MLHALISLACFGAVFVAAQTCSQTIDGQLFPNLIDVTLEDLQYGLEMGLFTSQDLVTAYLSRIDEVNGTLHMVRPHALQCPSSPYMLTPCR